MTTGYYAIDCLRMEKGYRAWGAELSSDWNPYECGLGFAVKLNKKEDFIGKHQAAHLKTQKLEKQLLCFTIDDSEAFPWGSESILYNGMYVCIYVCVCVCVCVCMCVHACVHACAHV